MQFTSASTYKLYVAFAMIHAVETGQSEWTSALNGTTLDACFQEMILDSDNACPEAYLINIGFSNFNKFIDDLGVSAQTDFGAYDMRTSANDLALFLEKLYRGNLGISADNREKLLDLMKSQVYRAGIPAGILANGSGAIVADKVGFLDTLKSDAGIVFSASGDYVLVIMTNGETLASGGGAGWEFVAELAAWIDSEMNR